jgi:hypothetical protein
VINEVEPITISRNVLAMIDRAVRNSENDTPPTMKTMLRPPEKLVGPDDRLVLSALDFDQRGEAPVALRALAADPPRALLRAEPPRPPPVDWLGA